ncbi:hypothetical protein E2C01_004523 [Portunus trituberculatus]|uniref:Uncharacterized protein n=1 Tax=Portunus trituberculatus TaxID=210409 RepID=A0A5B7CS01_PORTR|nr:hypothetical protein [Portunus trituberculatus]
MPDRRGRGKPVSNICSGRGGGPGRERRDPKSTPQHHFLASNFSRWPEQAAGRGFQSSCLPRSALDIARP